MNFQWLKKLIAVSALLFSASGYAAVGTIDFLDGAFIYVPTSDWTGALGLNSLVSLNNTGLLSVKVWSDFGDFYIGTSTLEVVTTSVPEPGSVALLALGLIGLGLLRKKNAA